ncbi:MAG: hypothetical protein AAF413_02240 [Patescibacteria group bacterium]
MPNRTRRIGGRKLLKPEGLSVPTGEVDYQSMEHTLDSLSVVNASYVLATYACAVWLVDSSQKPTIGAVSQALSPAGVKGLESDPLYRRLNRYRDNETLVVPDKNEHTMAGAPIVIDETFAVSAGLLAAAFTRTGSPKFQEVIPVVRQKEPTDRRLTIFDNLEMLRQLHLAGVGISTQPTSYLEEGLKASSAQRTLLKRLVDIRYIVPVPGSARKLSYPLYTASDTDKPPREVTNDDLAILAMARSVGGDGAFNPHDLVNGRAGAEIHADSVDRRASIMMSLSRLQSLALLRCCRSGSLIPHRVALTGRGQGFIEELLQITYNASPADAHNPHLDQAMANLDTIFSGEHSADWITRLVKNSEWQKPRPRPSKKR